MTFAVRKPIGSPTGFPLGYGDGNQASGYPGAWAFGPDILPSEYSLETSNKTATPATLTSVISSISEGDVITLEDGNYTSLTIADKPITARIQSSTLHGAVFSGSIQITGCDDIQIAGVKSLGISFNQCVKQTAYFTKSETISATRDDLVSMSQDINWYCCIADRAWPVPADKVTAAFIRQVNGNFVLPFVDGPQNGTIKRCIFMRATEDCFKASWCKNIGMDRNLYWGCQISEEDNATLKAHPDLAQWLSIDAPPEMECADIEFGNELYVNTMLPVIVEGQGLWAKDWPMKRFKIRNSWFSSGLNSTALGLGSVHIDTLVQGNITQQHFRGTGASNEFRENVFGVLNLDDGGATPQLTNNWQFYFNPPTQFFMYGRTGNYWEPRNMLVKTKEMWDAMPISTMVKRINDRMVIQGLEGFVPDGW